jgi:hypothetical protein
MRQLSRFWPYLLLLVVVIFLARGLLGGTGVSALGTDRERAIISPAALRSGGPPPQGIPALGFGGSFNGGVQSSPDPRFVTAAEAEGWIAPREPVLLVEAGGEARAYPLQVLTWHELVNDRLGGVPVAVSFCPLCNSAFAYDRRVPLDAEQREATLDFHPDAETVELDDAFRAGYDRLYGSGSAADITAGVLVTFGTSGMLYNSNLVMFDSATSTLWPQLLSQGGVGTLAGVRLMRYPAQIVAFEDFVQEHPGAQVLSRDTGFNRRYGNNPYPGYDDVDNPPFLFDGATDGRLPPKIRVVAFELGRETVAYPFDALERAGAVNDVVDGVPVAILWESGTSSALDLASISASRDVGAVGAFRRELDGRTLTLRREGEGFVDEETGSTWNLFGRAVAGELEGVRLEPIVHDNTLWFAWAAFRPETRVYRLP